MKHILIVSVAPIMCGVQKVLIDYLNIFNSLPHYKIDLFYLLQKGGYKLAQIPDTVLVKYGINEIEGEFFIYLEQVLRGELPRSELFPFIKENRLSLVRQINQKLLEKSIKINMTELLFLTAREHHSMVFYNLTISVKIFL